MVRCKTNGCKKHSRSPSKHCSNHTLQLRVTSVGIARKKVSVGIPKKEAGCFRSFVFDDEETFDSIRKIIDEEKRKMNLTTGHRSTVDGEREDLIPHLKSVIEQARNKVHFPLTSKHEITSHVVISEAPPKGSRSSSWVVGKIHRDFKDIEVSGCYSFELMLDELTVDNGSIKFRPDSKKKAHDPKNPSRGMEAMDSQTHVGPRDTVFVWDSRLLHQSLPN
jgi:hypothetical protein